jgi:pyruvate/2-oxoglutarate dehydrogenase complex dihydrolipoamide acyltransferase (E2) component
MKKAYYQKKIPNSRIATFDTFAIGLQKHHVSALLEFDVTESREKLKLLRKNGSNISFNAWLIKIISHVLQKFPEAASFRYNKKNLIIFNDINVSVLVEKKSGGQKVPIPVVIEKTNEKSALEITTEIENARNQELPAGDHVINRRSSFLERLYYHLPGIARRSVWRILLGNPKMVFPKMGNVVVTSIGMMGRINGWFIHRSVHPISFGIGSIIKKPVVIGNDIKIREILNMTILIDHDVIDGAPMVRLLKNFTESIEKGDLLDEQRS